MTIKIIFKGGQSENLREEFVERERYKRLVKIPNQIDTLYDERFYGFLDKEFNPVYIVDEPAVMQTFSDSPRGIQSIGFVVKAFNNFKKDYIERISASSRSFPDGLTGLNPIRGTESFVNLYNSHLTRTAIAYSERLKNNPKSADFYDFLLLIERMFEDTLDTVPISRSGFLLSDDNEVYTTGLVLDLAEEDFDTDEQKGIILQSEDFKCYCDYAFDAGFRVDKNAPWRLYVNLESDIIKTMIRGTTPEFVPPDRYRLLTAEDILNDIYREKSSKYDLYDIEDFLQMVWNEMTEDQPKVGNQFRTISQPLSVEWLLRMTLKVRLLEMGAFNEEEFEKQNLENLETSKIYGVRHAIDKIGEYCAQKFSEIIS